MKIDVFVIKSNQPDTFILDKCRLNGAKDMEVMRNITLLVACLLSSKTCITCANFMKWWKKMGTGKLWMKVERLPITMYSVC